MINFFPNVNFVSPQTEQFQILKTCNVFKLFLYVRHSMSVLENCPSYRYSTEGSKERQGPTKGVRFSEVFFKRELNEFEFGALQKKIQILCHSLDLSLTCTRQPAVL